MKKNIPYPVIDMKKTGKNIQKLREEHGLTVNDVRRYINLDNPQAIYQWQKGLSLPSVDHLLALSMLFEVKMEDIHKRRSLHVDAEASFYHTNAISCVGESTHHHKKADTSSSWLICI